MTRCAWAKTELSIAYHDTEWGVPVHDDRLLFEFLILEGAQAGLSWETILNKRENCQGAFVMGKRPGAADPGAERHDHGQRRQPQLQQRRGLRDGGLEPIQSARGP